MRARFAILQSGVPVELREILLRDKPEAFLKASPSATVPALEVSGKVLDESLDIMIWALKQNDPDSWLNFPDDGWQLVEKTDGSFKSALDRTKYASRYPSSDVEAERTKAAEWLRALDLRLVDDGFLMGRKPTLVDAAIFPFVRQFANIDRDWFDAQDWPNLQSWLSGFLDSPAFAAIMPKYPVWSPDQPALHFP